MGLKALLLYSRTLPGLDRGKQLGFKLGQVFLYLGLGFQIGLAGQIGGANYLGGFGRDGLCSLRVVNMNDCGAVARRVFPQ